MSESKGPLFSAPDNLLDCALDILRRESESLNTPHAVESRLMAAFATVNAASSMHSRTPQKAMRHGGLTRILNQWFAPGVAIAASVGMASWMMLSPLSQAGIEADTEAAAALAYAEEADNPFIALQSLERIALEPTPRLIAANVPRASLAAYGVPINPEMAGQSVRAEMLVAANGQPLAMRFLP